MFYESPSSAPDAIWSLKDLIPTNCRIYSAWMVLVRGEMGDCTESAVGRLWSPEWRLQVKEQLAHKCL